MTDSPSSAARNAAYRKMAERVLEEWCLKGDEPMEGEDWDNYCASVGVDPAVFAAGALAILARMTPAERAQRSKELYRERRDIVSYESMAATNFGHPNHD